MWLTNKSEEENIGGASSRSSPRDEILEIWGGFAGWRGVEEGWGRRWSWLGGEVGR
jgi:hypothetical protein